MSTLVAAMEIHHDQRGEVVDDWAGYKTCSKCRESKPHSAFWKNSSKYDGMQAACSACAGLRNLARYPDAKREPEVLPEVERAIFEAMRAWRYPVARGQLRAQA